MEYSSLQKLLLLGILGVLVFISAKAEKPDTRRILTRHQQYRSLTQAADMIKLTWSVSLERIAASVVEKCPTSVQSVRALSELRDLGANMGSAPYPPPKQDGYPEDIQTSIIDQWGSERSYYYPDSGCASAPCDSWWQIVWANASQIGCSLKVCEDKTVMVCIYNSRADTRADAPFKMGKACSACPKGFSKCEQGMCLSDVETPKEPDLGQDILPASGPDSDNDGHGNNNGSYNDASDEQDRKTPDEPDSANRKSLLTTSLCFLLLTQLA